MMMMRRKPWLIALMTGLLAIGAGVMAMSQATPQAHANTSDRQQP